MCTCYKKPRWNNIIEEEFEFLEAWLETPCVDDVCIEVTTTNIVDNMGDVEKENFNEIFMYWSPEEIKFYYELMLQWIYNKKIDDKE